MVDIYDDLDNFNEFEDNKQLKAENEELKFKLKQSNTKLNNLQQEILQDYDRLNVEHQRLLENFSSLLKTARAEVERKTATINLINDEKDQIVLRLLAKSKNKAHAVRNIVHDGNNTSTNQMYKAKNNPQVTGDTGSIVMQEQPANYNAERKEPDKNENPKLLPCKSGSKSESHKSLRQNVEIRDKENHSNVLRRLGNIPHVKNLRNQNDKFSSEEDETSSSMTRKSILSRDEIDTYPNRFRNKKQKEVYDDIDRRDLYPGRSNEIVEEIKRRDPRTRRSSERYDDKDRRDFLSGRSINTYDERNRRNSRNERPIEMYDEKDQRGFHSGRSNDTYDERNRRDSRTERPIEMYDEKDRRDFHTGRTNEIYDEKIRRDRSTGRSIDMYDEKDRRDFRRARSNEIYDEKDRNLDNANDLYDDKERRENFRFRDKSRHRRDFNDDQYRNKHVDRSRARFRGRAEFLRKRGFKQRRSPDKYNRTKSRDRRSNYDKEFDSIYEAERIPQNVIEKPGKYRDDVNEPHVKRRRIDSDRREEGEVQSDVPERCFSPDMEPLHTCQSPDENFIDQPTCVLPVKEIMATADITLEDPRMTSNRYVTAENRNETRSALSSGHVKLYKLGPWETGSKCRLENKRIDTNVQTQIDANFNKSFESGECDESDVYSDLITNDMLEQENRPTFKEKMTPCLPVISESVHKTEEFRKKDIKRISTTHTVLPKVVTVMSQEKIPIDSVSERKPNKSSEKKIASNKLSSKNTENKLNIKAPEKKASSSIPENKAIQLETKKSTIGKAKSTKEIDRIEKEMADSLMVQGDLELSDDDESSDSETIVKAKSKHKNDKAENKKVECDSRNNTENPQRKKEEPQTSKETNIGAKFSDLFGDSSSLITLEDLNMHPQPSKNNLILVSELNVDDNNACAFDINEPNIIVTDEANKVENNNSNPESKKETKMHKEHKKSKRKESNSQTSKHKKSVTLESKSENYETDCIKNDKGLELHVTDKSNEVHELDPLPINLSNTANNKFSENTSKIEVDKLSSKNCKEVILLGTDVYNKEAIRIIPATENNEPDIIKTVIMSTGVQNVVDDNTNNNEGKIPSTPNPVALATSTPERDMSKLCSSNIVTEEDKNASNTSADVRVVMIRRKRKLVK